MDARKTRQPVPDHPKAEDTDRDMNMSSPGAAKWASASTPALAAMASTPTHRPSHTGGRYMRGSPRCLLHSRGTEHLKEDWRKVGDGDNAWYFEAVEEFFGHLYGAMTSRLASQA